MPGRRGRGRARLSPEEIAKQEAEEKRLALRRECDRLDAAHKQEATRYEVFQLEREKLNHSWLVEKKRLEDMKDVLRDREREMQDLTERHEVEIKLLKQRVKHLLFEHQGETTAAKTEGVVTLKLAQDEHRESEAELRRDVRVLERRLRDMEAEHAAYVRELTREQDRALTQLRLEFERESRELQMQYEDLMESTRRRLFRRREEDLERLEARKAKHAEELGVAHQRAFEEVRRYFAEITQSNLDLIKTLKEEVAELARKDAADERRIVAIAQENKRMSAPLAKRLEESRRLHAEKEAYKKDLEKLQERKAKLLHTESQVNSLRWETDLMRQRLERLEEERDGLRTRFVRALHDVQQQVGFRGVVLEKKLDAATREVEKCGAKVSEVLAEARIDPASAGVVARSADEVVAAKDEAVAMLEAELQAAVDAHNSLIAKMAERLSAHGIRPEDLGFEPLPEHQLPPPPATAGGGGRGGGGGGEGRAREATPHSRASGTPHSRTATPATATSSKLPSAVTDHRVLRGGDLAASAAKALRGSA